MLPISQLVTFSRLPHINGEGGVNQSQLLTEEAVLPLLDAQHDGWKGDREGWVTLETGGIAWRAHYCRGRLLEVGWWGTLDRAPALARGRTSRPS